MRRHERPGSRRTIVGSAALLLVAAVGLAAVYGAIVPGQPQRQSLPGAALAVSDRADASFASDPAVTSKPTTPEPATPRAADPERTTPGPTTPESRIAASSTRPGVATTVDQDPLAGTSRASRSKPADATGAREVAVTHSGWVCDGTVRLEDPRGRRWSLGSAAFRTGPGYERVVLHIDRLGPGDGAAASMTAQALSAARVRGSAPGMRTPQSGQTTFSLHLAGPIEGNLGVRSYRPSGLRMLKEFSVYPAAGGSSRVLVSAASGECFRVRVPAWIATGPNARSAQIYLDIRS